MNYSSAFWSPDPGETLHTAQRRKVHNIIDQARITSSDHVLDIGCGWGDLAMEAVKRTGCRVTGLTLSAEQKRLAEKRVGEAGLEKQIEILLCDYRHAPRPDTGYDCVVSVEMLEHVGDKYMKQYFTSISRLLNPAGGRMVVQGITILNSVGHVSRTCRTSSHPCKLTESHHRATAKNQMSARSSTDTSSQEATSPPSTSSSRASTLAPRAPLKSTTLRTLAPTTSRPSNAGGRTSRATGRLFGVAFSPRTPWLPRTRLSISDGDGSYVLSQVPKKIFLTVITSITLPIVRLASGHGFWEIMLSVPL